MMHFEGTPIIGAALTVDGMFAVLTAKKLKLDTYIFHYLFICFVCLFSSIHLSICYVVSIYLYLSYFIFSIFVAWIAHDM